MLAKWSWPLTFGYRLHHFIPLDILLRFCGSFDLNWWVMTTAIELIHPPIQVDVCVIWRNSLNTFLRSRYHEDGTPWGHENSRRHLLQETITPPKSDFYRQRTSQRCVRAQTHQTGINERHQLCFCQKSSTWTHRKDHNRRQLAWGSVVKEGRKENREKQDDTWKLQWQAQWAFLFYSQALLCLATEQPLRVMSVDDRLNTKHSVGCIPAD